LQWAHRTYAEREMVVEVLEKMAEAEMHALVEMVTETCKG
jgi:hypothetical protein